LRIPSDFNTRSFHYHFLYLFGVKCNRFYRYFAFDWFINDLLILFRLMRDTALKKKYEFLKSGIIHHYHYYLLFNDLPRISANFYEFLSVLEFSLLLPDSVGIYRQEVIIMLRWFLRISVFPAISRRHYQYHLTNSCELLRTLELISSR